MPQEDADQRKAYTIATQRLREQFPKEFNDHRSAAAKELGVEWKPRPSKEEKAKAELIRLLEEHPTLLDVIEKRAAETE